MEGIEPKRRASRSVTAENLKRLARMIDTGAPISLKLNGRRVSLPEEANMSIDLERDVRSGRVEVDIRWLITADETSKSPSASELKEHSDDAGRSGNRSPHIRLRALITAPSN